MQSQAVVLAVKNRKAVILASGGIYEEIPDRAYFVGQKITWKQKQRDAVSMLRRGLMIAACLMLLLSSSGLAAAKYLPWTVVSVAYGEASVQYRLNAWDEVLSAEAVTDDGQALLDAVNTVSHEPIESVMERTFATIGQEDRAAGVSVEIASRVTDGKRAEEAIAEAGRANDVPITMEHVAWHEAGKHGNPSVHTQSEHNPPPMQDAPMSEHSEPAMLQNDPFTLPPDAEQPHAEEAPGAAQMRENHSSVSSPNDESQWNIAVSDQPLRGPIEETLPLVASPAEKADRDQPKEDEENSLNRPPETEESITPAAGEKEAPSPAQKAQDVFQPQSNHFDAQQREPNDVNTSMPYPSLTKQEGTPLHSTNSMEHDLPDMPQTKSDQRNPQGFPSIP